MASGIEWISQPVAAYLLGVSRQRVHQMVLSGRLVSRRYCGRTLVSSSSVSDRIAARKRKGGSDRGDW